MFSLLIAMLVVAGSYSAPSGNRNQLDASSPVATSNVNDVPPPSQPETDISISEFE
jgi:hypothetical protein